MSSSVLPAPYPELLQRNYTDSAKQARQGMPALFARNANVLQGLSEIRKDTVNVARNVIAAGFFTSFGGTPERAGLIVGYT